MLPEFRGSTHREPAQRHRGYALSRSRHDGRDQRQRRPRHRDAVEVFGAGATTTTKDAPASPRGSMATPLHPTSPRARFPAWHSPQLPSPLPTTRTTTPTTARPSRRTPSPSPTVSALRLPELVSRYSPRWHHLYPVQFKLDKAAPLSQTSRRWPPSRAATIRVRLAAAGRRGWRTSNARRAQYLIYQLRRD